MTYRPLRFGFLGTSIVPIAIWVAALLTLSVNTALGIAMLGIALITVFQFGLRLVHTVEVTDLGELAWRAGYRRGQLRTADIKEATLRIPHGWVVLFLPAAGRPAVVVGSRAGLATYVARVRSARPDLDLQLDPLIARLRRDPSDGQAA
jgi:hypothetical protein